MLENFKGDVNTFTYKKLSKEEMESRGILGRLIGVIADTKKPTRNGRLYGKELWENVFNSDLMQEKIDARVVLAELGHPADRQEIDAEKVCACLAEKPKLADDGKIYGVFDILSTPNGKLLKTLCDYGCHVGISSRGSGDVYDDGDGEYVDPETYNCECWDVVLVPAVKEARLQYVTESLSKKRYNKTLKEALLEKITSASDDDKKVMEKTLNELEIDLDASEEAAKVNDDVDSVDEDENVADLVDKDEEIVDSVDLTDSVKDFIVSILAIASGKNESDESICELADDTIAKLKESEISSKVLLSVLEDAVKSLKDTDEDDIDPVEADAPLDEKLDAVTFAKKLAKFINDALKDSDDPEEIKRQVEFVYNSTLKNPDDNLIYASPEKMSAKLECNDSSRSDKGIAPIEEAVDNGLDESDALLSEFKEALFQNKKLEERILQLQEELSVCNAKDVKNGLELANYKRAVVRLSESVTKKKKSLKDKELELADALHESEQLDTMYASKLKEALTRIKSLNDLFESKRVKSNELMHENDKLKKTNKDLAEQLQAAKRASNKSLRENLQTNNTLKESLEAKTREAEKLVTSNKALWENLESVKKASQNLYETKKTMEREFNAKVERFTKDNNTLKEQLAAANTKAAGSAKLAAKYQRELESVKDSYISATAHAYGISVDDVKRNLKESYTISDIDSVVSHLREQKINLSKLPCRLDGNTRISVTQVAASNNDDDDISSLSWLI